jgi:hypothetical protein
LFLFSAAIDLGLKDDLARFPDLGEFCQSIFIIREGKLSGEGPNPFKYPKLPQSTGIELCQVIKRNESLLKKLQNKGKKILNPVFAAHSVNDETLKFAGTIGIIELLENYVDNGLAFLIAHKVPHADKLEPDDEKRPDYVRHEEVVLDKDIVLNRLPQFARYVKQPKANPKFDLMMQTALQFFNNCFGIS